MISIHKIFIGVILGSIFLIFAATRLLSPSEIVSASPENNIEVSTNIHQKNDDTKLSCKISSLYPQEIQQWCDLIDMNAETYSLDSNLIAAVMLQESGGDKDAYSKSGAVGLMQIMPNDGVAANFMCINGPCFSNRPGLDELFNPEFNIEYGSRMLINLFGKYGNWRDALKAYGPMDFGYQYADIV
ncbi:MAG: lytic transglycosylase domain-containing protein, partial [Anaerolineaceae bacterium]|nr:lytic transglycosylase domain-containing protein [Anaerolineaceae bacterium]